MMDTTSDSQENRDGITRDRISDLPDHILVYILSFLSGQKAATTSILSSKWKKHWANHPNIILPHIGCTDEGPYAEFIDKYFQWCIGCIDEGLYPDFIDRHLQWRIGCTGKDEGLYPDFIDRYLQWRKEQYDISEFKLDCSLVYCSATRVLTWIDSVISRNVEELVLRLTNLTGNVPLTLPPTVFTSDSLRSLTISMPCVLILPEIIALPNIKTLHLARVQFSDNESIGRLVSGCPLLEELCLSLCSLETVADITISSQSLRHLVIRDHSGQTTVSVEAANLISFDYGGDLASQWSLLEQQPSLTEARVVVLLLRATAPREDRTALHTFNLFRSLQNVRTLAVSTRTIMAFYRAFEIPAFENLRQLDITTWVQEKDLISLSNFLRKFPNVETLNFRKMRSSYDEENMGDDERAELEQIVLANPLPRLRRISFSVIHKSWVEECVLRVVVRFAPNLERILISPVLIEPIDLKLYRSFNILQEINRNPAAHHYNQQDRILELEF